MTLFSRWKTNSTPMLAMEEVNCLVVRNKE